MRASATSIEFPAALGLNLAGYATSRPATDLARPLEANLLYLTDDAGHSALLASLDLLFIGPLLKAKLREAFPGTAVLAFATHTHFAPATDPQKPRLGVIDPRWIGDLAESVIAAAVRLRDGSGDEATVSVSSGPVGLSVNRRRAWPWPVLSRRGFRRPGMAMAPNLGGPTADCARVAVLRRADGDPIAVISSWACHPTTSIEPTKVSSDYIGPVRSALRSRLGEVPVLHLQGFTGDVRAPGGPPSRHAALKSLLRGPRFYPFDRAGLEAWEDRVSFRIAEVADRGSPRPLAGALDFRSTQIEASSFLEGARPRPFEVGRLRIGDALALTYLEAEPSSEHADRVTSVFPGDWPIGYAGDVFGYLPTDSQVRQRGYEVEGYMPLFGMSGRYRGSVDGALTAALNRLAG